MGRRKKYDLSPEDILLVEACPNLSDREKEVMKCVGNYGIEECPTVLGMGKATIYKILKQAYPKFIEWKQSVEEIKKKEEEIKAIIEAKKEEKTIEEKVEATRERAREEKRQEEEVRTKSRVSPERHAESAALKKLGVMAAKEAEKRVKEYMEIGKFFYEEFKEIKAITGKSWEELVREAYRAYVRYQEEEKITEQELLEKIIELLL